MQRNELSVSVASTGRTIGVFSLDRIGRIVIPTGKDRNGKVRRVQAARTIVRRGRCVVTSIIEPQTVQVY